MGEARGERREARGQSKKAVLVAREGKPARRKHHDLVAWQVSIDLVQAVYELTASFPVSERYGLTTQLRRSAVSVPSNIAEGAARNTKKEFFHFVTVARGSLSELDTQLVIAKQLGYLSDDSLVQEKLDRAFGLVGGLLRSIDRGDK